jgi:hypothetical protein
MERIDTATTDLVEQEIKGCFPEGALDSVKVLQYGDDPAVEPGEVMVQLTVGSAAEPEGPGAPPEPFPRAYRDTLQQVQRDIQQRWPQTTRFRLVSGQGETRGMFMLRPGPEEPPGGDLTPVMARLGPADLETLDTLITAGFAANRAQAVRWALARIRERPAYAELRERAREIENLKSQF